jgi:UDP-N-acetyl-D-glucosamine/UDP-N-acetyl-D-galactosamine dehydrogenase
MLGITFKENCPDIRNTKAIDIYNELITYNLNCDVYDPWANPSEVEHEYKIPSHTSLPDKKYDAVVLAVAHKTFESLQLNHILKENAVIYDVKATLPKEIVDGRL